MFTVSIKGIFRTPLNEVVLLMNTNGSVRFLLTGFRQICLKVIVLR